MKETNKPYWIVDNAIIFKPSFYECLDHYTDIISNYQTLIFSNYDDPNLALKNNNNYNEKNCDLFEFSIFNRKLNKSLLKLFNLQVLIFGFFFNYPLGNSLSNLTNLRVLTFGNNFNKSLDNSLLDLVNLEELTFSKYFNQPLGDSLSNLVNLRVLTFGEHFNQPVDDSLSNLVNLRKLTFGHWFNQPLTDLLSNLVYLDELSLGYDFNQPIMIPDGIKKLTLNCDSQSIIDYLPSNIEELVLGDCFNLELNDLPNSIKKIKIINEFYNKKLNNLPNQIKTLEISSRYVIPIDREYKNLNIVKKN